MLMAEEGEGRERAPKNFRDNPSQCRSVNIYGRGSCDLLSGKGARADEINFDLRRNWYRSAVRPVCNFFGVSRHARSTGDANTRSVPADRGDHFEISIFLAKPACVSITKVFSRGGFGGGGRREKEVRALWLLKSIDNLTRTVR